MHLKDFATRLGIGTGEEKRVTEDHRQRQVSIHQRRTPTMLLLVGVRTDRTVSNS